MYLDKVSIMNYKSCRLLSFNLKPNNTNNFIGLNDSGKSSIIKAVEFLFNKPICSFNKEGNNKSDLSNSVLKKEEFDMFFTDNNLPVFENYDSNSIYVLGCLKFSENEIDEVLKLELSNPLGWAIENLQNDSVWLLRRIDANSANTYLLLQSEKEHTHIFTTTATVLTALRKELNVTGADISNLNGEGRFSNLEVIRAINSKLTLESLWVDYKIAKNDSEVFPVYEYFDWNCSMDEILSIAGSLMKDKINEFILPIKAIAIQEAEKAEEAINKEFNNLKDIISNVAPEIEAITTRIHFDVKEKVSDIMVQKLQSDGLIHLDNQGEGLKRKIWFSLIKAKSESHGTNPFKKYIWAFDEPETHLYPGAQRDFFDILKKLSRGNVQTLISTHSTIFIDKAKTNDIFNVFKDASGYTNLSFCEDIDSIYESLQVKNSDFLFHDKFLIVEGDTEQYLIPKLYELYTGRTFIEDNIQLINIEGKDKWRINKGILNSISAGFKKFEDSMILLFDNDMSYELDTKDKTDKVFFVGVQDIEDSIESNIWVEIVNHYYNGKLTIDLAFIQKIKESIPTGKGVHSNNKFFKKLDSCLREKWQSVGNDVDEFIPIPSKGKESSEFILAKLNSSEMIPKQISDAFNKLVTI